jgi:hypothetical protein
MGLEKPVPETEWPRCWECGSEETTLHPASDTYTCTNCGLQWEANGDIVSEPGFSASTQGTEAEK